MSPVAYAWGPFSAKIFLKIWFCKIDPLLPPHIDFNTIPYFTYGCPYRGVKEGKLKKGSLFAFLGSARAVVGSISKIGQFFDHLNFEKYESGCLCVGPIFG